MTITTSIIPNKLQFAKKAEVEHALNYEAICIFIATGFFMDDDTYWKDLVCLAPGHKHELDENGYLIKSEPTYQWHYTPRDITFEEALNEYVALLTEITKEQVGNSKVILPLSGGLDSRSQALIFKNLPNSVQSFSYAFEGGYPEHQIAKQIAANCGFNFEAFTIPKGYLWDVVEEMSQLIGGYSEFTHPRQMAVLPELKQMEGVFSLGHWGDVLFDRGVPEGTQASEIIPLLLKKMVKPKGMELAEKLWDYWNLSGDFKTYLLNRVEVGLEKIKIEDISAKVRAFKSSQWAHRWTTTNLCIFEAAHPINMPYYDNRMCEFICSIPEAYLADRRLQIAHLKQDRTLANITWQEQKPFNLNTYQYNKTPYNLPYRISNKVKRVIKSQLGNPYIQRNWELQFLGEDNAKRLENHLFNINFNRWIPKAFINETYEDFKHKDAIGGSHAISMLLTLSSWHQQNFNDL
ncbi:asparagine synthase-related protein [Winogradskyella bathintestinalis]|uniref:asparagine synthase (glutamine-hydrolyzing) n=1 Tax=Winogradskyella bathintestinalis TaxID=3035208 RepID=A0ABT7ZTR8_9FLAO|nr:asparagine synthase-related protein [Winogradskyella bathintestinalis]MDN3492417.1 asparagine synthase-related protein [Winogradskyella bathintestinalis]